MSASWQPKWKAKEEKDNSAKMVDAEAVLKKTGRPMPVRRSGWDSDNWRDTNTGNDRRGYYSSDGYRSTGSDKRKGRGNPNIIISKADHILLGGGQFTEDAVNEVNLQLQDYRIDLQLPTLAIRTPSLCEATVTKSMQLIRNKAELKLSDKHCAILLRALGISLAWCPSLSDEQTMKLLSTLRPYTLTETSQKSSDADTDSKEETRYHAINSLNTFFRSCFPKKKQGILAHALSLLPEHDVGVGDSTLLGLMLFDPSHRVRIQASNAACHLIEHTAQIMTQATPMSGSRSFMSYSEKLGCILEQAHANASVAVKQTECSPQYTTAILHLLQAIVNVTPFHALPKLAQSCSQLLPTIAALVCPSQREKGVVIAAIQLLAAMLGTKRSFKEMDEAFKSCTYLHEQTFKIAKQGSPVAYRYESIKLWTAAARNYPEVVGKHWDTLIELVSALQTGPDQTSRLITLTFLSAVSEGVPTVLGSSDEIPVIDFSCFGPANLPPGASSETITQAGTLQRRPTGAELATSRCVLANKPKVLIEVINSLVIPLCNDPVAAVKSHAIAVLGNIPPSLLDSMPESGFVKLFEVVVDSSTGSPATRGAVARVLGSWAPSQRIMERRKIVANVLLSMFEVSQQGLHQKAAWAIASFCDQMRETMGVGDQEIISAIVHACVQQLSKYNGKTPWNVVRALGNSGLLYEGKIEEVLQALLTQFDDSNVKVRWNTAYAVAQLFRNPTLRQTDASIESLARLVSRLCVILHTEVNFKVRIQACWALSALTKFPRSALTLPLALRGVAQALEAGSKDVDFESYRYRDVLMVSLKGLLLHVVRSSLRESESDESKSIIITLFELRDQIISVLKSMLPADIVEPSSISSPTNCKTIDDIPISTKAAASTDRCVNYFRLSSVV
eukprot:TRINITY_DN8614_c0_g1_i2.p1 TRINITY_DN8614_c0_g1~~TRINITY_DN8614_c0_g1_i2.p1  ORF type:complete len:901 (+),score=129.10 TRINITY_DN8614_c0_g1_i2:144-2846(+)